MRNKLKCPRKRHKIECDENNVLAPPRRAWQIFSDVIKKSINLLYIKVTLRDLKQWNNLRFIFSWHEKNGTGDGKVMHYFGIISKLCTLGEDIMPLSVATLWLYPFLICIPMMSPPPPYIILFHLVFFLPLRKHSIQRRAHQPTTPSHYKLTWRFFARHY